MRILWLSNRIFQAAAEKKSGTWLKSLAREFSNHPEITLANISTANVAKITSMDFENVRQWGVPSVPLRRNGLPPPEIVDELRKVVQEFAPDVIQVWGTEGYWGLLTARKLLPGRHLLTIQGVLSSIKPVFFGGLSTGEICSCIGLRELLFPKSIPFFAKVQFQRRVLFENEIIRNHKFIVTQSSWSKGHVEAINRDVVSFSTERTLRSEFLESPPWDGNRSASLDSSPIIFANCAGRPYKGIHVLIRAVAILARRYPSIVLKISGAHLPTRLRMSGYDKWLRRLAKRLGVSKNVCWLGNLNADEIIRGLLDCNVFVNSSYVESYSVSLAEALYLGVPSVVSYAGAMPELAEDNRSALFFTPGDHVMCANKIALVLEDRELSTQLSARAREAGIARNNSNWIVENQILIYQQLCC